MTSARKRGRTTISTVVYEHARLDDLEVRTPASATASLIASIPTDLSAEEVSRLRPSSVLTGENPEAIRSRFGPTTVTCRNGGYLSLALWLPDAVIVVRCRRLVMEEIADSWVDQVVAEASPPKPPPARRIRTSKAAG